MAGRAGAPRRGQAMVETALGLLVFITLVVFGIHFAELGFLSLKVQEAANFGLFEPTLGGKMHDTFAPDWTLYPGAIAAADVTVGARYQDFDGRTSRAGGSAAVTQVFTRAGPINARCGADGAVPSLGPATPRTAAAGLPAGDSGMSCQAESVMTGFRLPASFFDRGGGFFQERNWTPLDLRICAAGRATGGSCQGRYGILLDDWGLSGPASGSSASS